MYFYERYTCNYYSMLVSLIQLMYNLGWFLNQQTNIAYYTWTAVIEVLAGQFISRTHTHTHTCNISII